MPFETQAAGPRGIFGSGRAFFHLSTLSLAPELFESADMRNPPILSTQTFGSLTFMFSFPGGSWADVDTPLRRGLFTALRGRSVVVRARRRLQLPLPIPPFLPREVRIFEKPHRSLLGVNFSLARVPYMWVSVFAFPPLLVFFFLSFLSLRTLHTDTVRRTVHVTSLPLIDLSLWKHDRNFPFPLLCLTSAPKTTSRTPPLFPVPRTGWDAF